MACPCTCSANGVLINAIGSGESSWHISQVPDNPAECAPVCNGTRLGQGTYGSKQVASTSYMWGWETLGHAAVGGAPGVRASAEAAGLESLLPLLCPSSEKPHGVGHHPGPVAGRSSLRVPWREAVRTSPGSHRVLLGALESLWHFLLVSFQVDAAGERWRGS